MRSGERWSLRARVALSAAAVSALTGLGAAGVAASLLDDFGRAAEERRLVEAAMVAQTAFATADDPLAEMADNEAREVATLGVRLAVFERGQRVGGAAGVPYLEAERCVDRSDAGTATLVCALGGVERRVVVSAPSAGRAARGRMLLLAVALASGISAAVSALLSAVLAGWSLAPLTRLTERVERVSADAPAAADLGQAEGSTEVEALRETIQRLLGRLGEALERSRTFASGAAHELRTPLATMMAELELVAEGAPESVAAPLGRVRRTLDRLAVLVERLLGLAAGDRAQIAHDTVALEDVVSDVLASRLDRERARIEVHLDDQGMVRGDEALLRTVVDNLIDNALKFSNDRPVQVRVAASGADVWVLITDEGPGIDPTEAARLLRAFERGASASAPGFGLGLAIAAHAVRLHGGDLRLSMLERGTEARVRLPAWSPAG